MNTTESSTSSGPPGLLDIDVSVRPQSFDSGHLLEEHERGRKEDADDLNAVLAEFEGLSEEFQLWAYARVKKEGENSEDVLRIKSEEIQEEEIRQDAKRSTLAQFIDSFKQAFKLLNP